MHTNPAFRAAPDAQSLDFARETGFGTLTVAGSDGPLVSHVPFLVSADGAHVEAHLTRSNPILRALPSEALWMVMGPSGYISPEWYGEDDQVPTYNYVAVHLRGEMVTEPEDALLPHLDRLSAKFEAGLAPKPPWKTEKMSDDALQRMLRMIVPMRMDIHAVEGTWKLNQNKSDAARLGAASAVGNPALAALMREPPMR